MKFVCLNTLNTLKQNLTSVKNNSLYEKQKPTIRMCVFVYVYVYIQNIQIMFICKN